MHRFLLKVNNRTNKQKQSAQGGIFMAIHYWCRHCGVNVGSIEKQLVDSEQLGFHKLDPQERSEMINYDQDGHMHIQTICEDCEEALNQNPTLHENKTFIQ